MAQILYEKHTFKHNLNFVLYTQTHLGQLVGITRVSWNQLRQSLETIVNGGLTKCCGKSSDKIIETKSDLK